MFTFAKTREFRESLETNMYRDTFADKIAVFDVVFSKYRTAFETMKKEQTNNKRQHDQLSKDGDENDGGSSSLTRSVTMPNEN